MFANLDLYEMLAIAGCAYVGITTMNDPVLKMAAWITLIAGVVLLLSALSTTDTYAAPSPGPWGIGNLDAMEMIVVAALGVAAYKYFAAGKYLHGGIVAAVAAFNLFDFGGSPTSDINL